MFEISETIRWAIVQTVVFLGYIFNEMRRVRKEMDGKVDAKVDQVEFDKERKRWEDDMNKLRQDNQNAVDRLEKQSNDNITQRFNQLDATIKSTESHLSSQITLVIKMINQKMGGE